jgi:hypothetical protein
MGLAITTTKIPGVAQAFPKGFCVFHIGSSPPSISEFPCGRFCLSALHIANFMNTFDHSKLKFHITTKSALLFVIIVRRESKWVFTKE